MSINEFIVGLVMGMFFYHVFLNKLINKKYSWSKKYDEFKDKNKGFH
jgi:hypothetical protein